MSDDSEPGTEYENAGCAGFCHVSSVIR